MMFTRSHLSSLAVAALVVCAGPRPCAGAPAAANLPAAEAQRLYDRASDYVTTLTEGKYSYNYLQFYWKRAQTNLDWIALVYPDTPVGRSIKAGQVKLGSFELGYFRERVLPKLEEKRQATVDAITCAIYLCELKGDATWDESRLAAVNRILEALSRQQRWGEALRFPVPGPAVAPQAEADKQATIFQVAARFEQDKLVKELLAATPTERLPRIHAILGEALALRGQPRQKITELLALDPANEVKLAVLSGMARREARIRLSAMIKVPTEKIMLIGDVLKFPEVRDDVEAMARTLFPQGNPGADAILAAYRAALGERPANGAVLTVHQAYMEYLTATERFTDLSAYPSTPGLTAANRSGSELKLIELLAQAGRLPESEKLRTTYAATSPGATEAATLAQFRGRMNAESAPLVVQQFTLSELPFKDPAFAAQALMEWSLSPTRSIRGAGPYDAVVQKFAPGFENLPLPKSKDVAEAASVQKAY